MTTLTQLDESLDAIISRAREGDESAWTTIFVRFNQFVFNYALSRTKDQSLSDDIVNEVFLIAYRKLNTLKSDHAFAAWIKVIAKNLTTNVLIRKKLPQQELPVEVPIWDDPAEDMLIEETRLKVLDEIDRLQSQIYREALSDFYLFGKSLKEIAQERDLPIGTVKRRLHVARNKLRDAIGQNVYL